MILNPRIRLVNLTGPITTSFIRDYVCTFSYFEDRTHRRTGIRIMNVDAGAKECRKARTGSAASGTPRRAIKIYI